MSENQDRIQEQAKLWDMRSQKSDLISVMCSDFSIEEANLADERQKSIISAIMDQFPSGQLGLELGSGLGRLSKKWLEYVKKLIALDISHEMLKKLPNSPNIHPIKSDLLTLPFTNNTFDVVFISNILGHLKNDDDLSAAIIEINRVTSDNSRLFIDEMIGEEGELVKGHYKIRNPPILNSFLSEWSEDLSKPYNFGRQPHIATVYRRITY